VKVRIKSEGGLLPEEKRTLLSLLDACPPLSGIGATWSVDGPSELLSALDYYAECWLRIWQAWQDSSGSRPPRIEAYHCKGGVWISPISPAAIAGQLRTLCY